MVLSILVVLLTLAVYCYYKYDKTYHYWKRKGVTQLQPIPLYGDARQCLEENISDPELTISFYKEFKELGIPFGGVYFENQPVFVPIDPELVKTMTTKDYEYFDSHFGQLPKTLFFNNLFHMSGSEWKDMRRKLTPVFTTGKMKMMFDTLLEKAEGLRVFIDEKSQSDAPVEIKGVIVRFTTDVIGSVGFGVECNSLKEDSDFYTHGQKLFKQTSTKKPALLSFLIRLIPFKFIKHGINFSSIENFFRDVVKATLKHREDNKVIRKDFLHLMIQLKNKGTITELSNDTEDVYEKTVKEDVISLEDLTGEVLLFFTAGFETSSTTMSFAILELTQNPHMQDKIRKEVREILARHNGKFTYEAVQEMTYIEMVIKETLRMYPPLAILPRLCTKNYKVPNTDIVIEKGTPVKISTWGMHKDPEYFPNPNKFDPERFSPANKDKIKPYTYIPFGDGPRTCLGMRFAMMESKIGLAVLLKDHTFTLHKSTSYPPKFVKNNFIPTVEGGVMVNITKVK